MEKGGVRAYPSGEATGDIGWLTSLELHRVLSPTQEVSAFIDSGRIIEHQSPFDEKANPRRLSGVGMAYSGGYQSYYWSFYATRRTTGSALSEPDQKVRFGFISGVNF